MKTLIAATALSLVAGAAFAGEGQGNPFPFRAPPIAVSIQGYQQEAGGSQNPYPFTAASRQRMTSMPVLPTAGSDGVMQTANSLPAGFEDGAPAVANLNQNAPTPTRLAQPVAPIPGTRG